MKSIHGLPAYRTASVLIPMFSSELPKWQVVGRTCLVVFVRWSRWLALEVWKQVVVLRIVAPLHSGHEECTLWLETELVALELFEMSVSDI